MPVFKKKKYASGGAIGNFLNNPGFGLGLEYIPTAQELPDLDGLMYVEQAKNNARTQLEALRKERTPDVSALTAPLDELEMFGSIKNDFKRDIQGKVASFKQKMASDPDFAFSMEARNEYNSLLNSLNSSDYQYHALRYKEQEADYRKAMEQGLGETMLVSNGQIPLVNRQTGRIEMKSTDEAQRLLTSPETMNLYSGFNKTSQLWDYYHKYAGKNFNDYVSLSGRSTVKDAKKEVDEVFKNVASSMMEGVAKDEIVNKNGVAVYQMFKEKTSSNRGQLETAVKQVMNTISQGSLDAMQGNYIQRTGDLSQEGFARYMEGVISGEAQIRTENGVEISGSPSVLGKDIQGRLMGVDGNLGQPMATSGSINLRDRNFFPDMGDIDAFETPVIAKSSLAGNEYDIEAQKTLIGKMMVFNGESNSTGADGNLESKNQTIYAATSRGFYLMGVSTGQIIRKKGNEFIIETDTDKVPAGILLAAKDGENVYDRGRLHIQSTESEVINIKGQDYLVYPGREPGEYVVASPKAFGMYHGFTKKDLDPKSETVVYKALDPRESIQAFSSPNFSVDYKMKKYYEPATGKMTTDGKKEMEYILSEIDQRIDLLNQGVSGTSSKIQADQNIAARNQLQAQKERLSAMFGYIQAVENGSQPVGESDMEELEKIKFQISMFLNEANRDNQISTVQGLTTAISNSFSATTKFNNIVR